MRDGICVCVVVVVVLMVAIGVVVLVAAVGVVVLVIVVSVERVVYRCVGGGLYRSASYYGVRWNFCGVGGGRSGTGGRVCCEASPVVFQWEGYFLCCFNLMSVDMNGLSVAFVSLGW